MFIRTGKPIENWGGAVPIDGFPKSGSVDMLKDLIADWTPWRQTERKYDPAKGCTQGDRTPESDKAPAE